MGQSGWLLEGSDMMAWSWENRLELADGNEVGGGRTIGMGHQQDGPGVI